MRFYTHRAWTDQLRFMDTPAPMAPSRVGFETSSMGHVWFFCRWTRSISPEGLLIREPT